MSERTNQRQSFALLPSDGNSVSILHLRIFDQKSVFRNLGSEMETCRMTPMPKLKAVLKLLLSSLLADSETIKCAIML